MCSVLNDTCFFTFDLECDVGDEPSQLCDSDTDCFDCDPCQQHAVSCQACLEASCQFAIVRLTGEDVMVCNSQAVAHETSLIYGLAYTDEDCAFIDNGGHPEIENVIGMSNSTLVPSFSSPVYVEPTPSPSWRQVPTGSLISTPSESSTGISRGGMIALVAICSVLLMVLGAVCGVTFFTKRVLRQQQFSETDLPPRGPIEMIVSAPNEDGISALATSIVPMYKDQTGSFAGPVPMAVATPITAGANNINITEESVNIAS